MKNKTVAGTLALLMGVFGVHRFYLGQRFVGIVHLLFFLMTFGITIEEDAPFILIPALVGFIDAVLLFVMPQEEFDDRYNKHRKAGRAATAPAWRETYPVQSYGQVPVDRYAGQTAKQAGIEAFRRRDFRAAIHAFEQALEENFEDPSTHFNLACSFSMIQDAEASFYHLEHAIVYGFANLDKIHGHEALAFLRAQPLFGDFVANGYRRPEFLPAGKPSLSAPPAAEKPAPAPSKGEDLLDQIIKLGHLREKGILTEQEFTRQKQKLLGEN